MVIQSTWKKHLGGKNAIAMMQEVEPELIQRLVQLEAAAFGHGGMNEWHLVPLIRRGCVCIIRKDKEIVGLIQYMLNWNNPQLAYMVSISIDEACRRPWNITVYLNILENMEKNSIVLIWRFNFHIHKVIAEFRLVEAGEPFLG